MVFAGMAYWSVVWQTMNHGVCWLAFWSVVGQAMINRVCWLAYWSQVWQTMNHGVCWFGLLICSMVGYDSCCMFAGWFTGL